MNRDSQAENISAFLDGEMSEAEARQFLVEIGRDPEAAAELKRMLKLRELIADAMAPADGVSPRLPVELQQRWQAAIRAEATGQSHGKAAAASAVAGPQVIRPRSSFWRAAAPMAATLLIGAGVLWIFNRGNSPVDPQAAQAPGMPSQTQLAMHDAAAEERNKKGRQSEGSPEKALNSKLKTEGDSTRPGLEEKVDLGGTRATADLDDGTARPKTADAVAGRTPMAEPTPPAATGNALAYGEAAHGPGGAALADSMGEGKGPAGAGMRSDDLPGAAEGLDQSARPVASPMAPVLPPVASKPPNAPRVPATAATPAEGDHAEEIQLPAESTRTAEAPASPRPVAPTTPREQPKEAGLLAVADMEKPAGDTAHNQPNAQAVMTDEAEKVGASAKSSVIEVKNDADELLASMRIPYNAQNVMLVKEWVGKHGGGARMKPVATVGETLSGPPFLGYVNEHRTEVGQEPTLQVSLPAAELPALKAYLSGLQPVDIPTNVGQTPNVDAAASMELRIEVGQNDNSTNK